MHAAIAEKSGASLDILPLHLSATAARSLVETSFMDADRPTGVYAFGDQYAVALLSALSRSGIQVPQEVALVGSSNLPLGEYIWPSLTSMSFDAIDIGKRAVQMLHALHQELPLSEELTRPLVPRLIQRESSRVETIQKEVLARHLFFLNMRSAYLPLKVLNAQKAGLDILIPKSVRCRSSGQGPGQSE